MLDQNHTTPSTFSPLSEAQVTAALGLVAHIAIESGAIPHVREVLELLEYLDQSLAHLQERNGLSRALFLEAAKLYQEDRLLLHLDGSIAIECSDGQIYLLSKEKVRIELVDELTRDITLPGRLGRDEVNPIRNTLSPSALIPLRAAASSAADREFIRQELPKAFLKGMKEATALLTSHIIEQQLELLVARLQ